MRIVLHGQQAFGQAVLEKLLDRGEDVVAVCCAPSKEGKPEDPLALFAKEKGLSDAILDRLLLNDDRIESMANRVGTNRKEIEPNRTEKTCRIESQCALCCVHFV